MAPLDIYVLNVGQGDTSIIKTPGGKIIVIDAYRPAKVTEVLNALRPDGVISHLVVTHPHRDHYSAVPKLLRDFQVRRVTLAPFWFEPGTPLYHQIINEIQARGVPFRFLSGYERTYPDGGTYPTFQNELCLELLGPSNDVLRDLEESAVLVPNHLSIIARLRYGQFSMVFAADAQMENWSHYDREGMLEHCDVLKVAHHGSKRGSQWERLERLAPKLAIVSSELGGTHDLPDLIGSSIFAEYADQGHTVVLTGDAGTLRIEVDDPSSGQFAGTGHLEGAHDEVFSQTAVTLALTNWGAIVASKAAHP